MLLLHAEAQQFADICSKYIPLNDARLCRTRSNLFRRNDSLTESCTKKCVPADYREGDLNKGESVCLDRCVSKFFDVNIKVSEKMQGEANANKQGGGAFGM
jgi:hypothetical protein